MIIVGFITGLLVSLTSVGTGAIIMVFLLHFWHVPLDQVVGTDLAIAIVIIAIASFSHLLIGSVNAAVITPLILGGILGAFIDEHFYRWADKEKIKLVIIVILALVGLSMLISPNR